MKKFTLLKIVCAIAILFSTSNVLGQVYSADECTNGSCGANDVKITNVFVGTPGDDPNVDPPIPLEDCVLGEENGYKLYATIDASSKYNLFVQYYLKINGNYVETNGDVIEEGDLVDGKPAQKHSVAITGQIADGVHQFGEISYVCGTELRLTDIYFSWTANEQGAPGCQSENNSKCDRPDADIIVDTPLIANFVFVPNCEFLNTLDFTSTSTGGDRTDDTVVPSIPDLTPYKYTWV